MLKVTGNGSIAARDGVTRQLPGPGVRFVTINKELEAKQNQIIRRLAGKVPVDKIIDEAYPTALSRFPTPVGKQKIPQGVGRRRGGGPTPGH
jgi:hypothetical protein